MSEQRYYMLFDGRACGGRGTDDAVVLVSSGSQKEARKDAKLFSEGACYSYRVEGDLLKDERWEWDF